MTFRRRAWRKGQESQRIHCPQQRPNTVSMEKCRECRDVGEVKEHGVECNFINRDALLNNGRLGYDVDV